MKDYLILYPEDFKSFNDWKTVCMILGVYNGITSVKIPFYKEGIVTTEEEL